MKTTTNVFEYGYNGASLKVRPANVQGICCPKRWSKLLWIFMCTFSHHGKKFTHVYT